MPQWLCSYKCPKCGSNFFSVQEKVIAIYNFEAEEGVIEFDCVEDQPSKILSTTCICNECGNTWHPRQEIFGKRID